MKPTNEDISHFQSFNRALLAELEQALSEQFDQLQSNQAFAEVRDFVHKNFQEQHHNPEFNVLFSSSLSNSEKADFVAEYLHSEGNSSFRTQLAQLREVVYNHDAAGEAYYQALKLHRRESEPLRPSASQAVLIDIQSCIFYLSGWIRVAPKTSASYRESAGIFANSRFKSLDGVAVARSFLSFASRIDEVAAELKPMLDELREAERLKMVPARELVGSIARQFAMLGNSAREVPKVGGVWRWNPDYRALTAALEPINQREAPAVWVTSMMPHLENLSRATQQTK
jgi:hypothetical protein